MTPTTDLHKVNVYLCTHTHTHHRKRYREKIHKRGNKIDKQTRKKCSTSLATKLIEFKTTALCFLCVRLVNTFKEAMTTVQGTVSHTPMGTTQQTKAGQSLTKPQATAQMPPCLSLWPQEAMTGHLERNFNYLVAKSG